MRHIGHCPYDRPSDTQALPGVETAAFYRVRCEWKAGFTRHRDPHHLGWVDDRGRCRGMAHRSAAGQLRTTRRRPQPSHGHGISHPGTTGHVDLRLRDRRRYRKWWARNERRACSTGLARNGAAAAAVGAIAPGVVRGAGVCHHARAGAGRTLRLDIGVLVANLADEDRQRTRASRATRDQPPASNITSRGSAADSCCCTETAARRTRIYRAPMPHNGLDRNDRRSTDNTSGRSHRRPACRWEKGNLDARWSWARGRYRPRRTDHGGR